MNRLGVAAFVVALLSWGCLTPAQAQVLRSSPGIYAFEGVTVLPMDSDRLLPDHTVVVSDGRITIVAPASEAEVPVEAIRIPGGGRFLLPGLADMAHRLPAADDPLRVVVLEEVLFLNLSNGITTLRSMDAAPYQLELREAIASGAVLGPTLYLGAPALDARSAPEFETAVDAIRDRAESGYDLITIDSTLSATAWAEIARAAVDRQIAVGGRTPSEVPISAILEAGPISLDHLDGWLDVTRADNLSRDSRPAEVYGATDREKLLALAASVAAANAYVVPTQYLENILHGWHRSLNGSLWADSVKALPEFRYVPQSQRDGWATSARNLWVAAQVTPESAAAFSAWRRELLSALHEAGAALLLGTGAADLLTVPGFAVHRELPYLIDAGMSNYEALASATRLPAEYVATELGLEGDFGTIEVGKRGDLILLDQSPFESLDALHERVGVMVRGQWLSAEAIEERLAAIADRHKDFEVD